MTSSRHLPKGPPTTVLAQDCIDLTDRTAPVGNLTVAYQITGGTGRFEGASGALTYTATLTPVLRNASNAPALLTLTGEIEGTVSGRP